jgi:hypothetical protein
MAGSYWAESTRSLLDFQLAQPQSCLRLRREDLESDPQEQLRRVWSFLGLAAPPAAIRPESDPVLTGRRTQTQFPADRLPPRLRRVINELNARLGYSPL